MDMKKTVSKLVRLESAKQPVKPTETVCMKYSKAAVHRKTHRIPQIKFEDLDVAGNPAQHTDSSRAGDGVGRWFVCPSTYDADVRRMRQSLVQNLSSSADSKLKILPYPPVTLAGRPQISQSEVVAG